MHDLAFADAARPRKAVVLGVPLLPYSLGHDLLLTQRENPFLLLEREAFDLLPAAQQISALAQAVLVCSRDWRGNHRPVRPWHKQPFISERTDWPVQIAEFRNYHAAGRALFPGPSPQADHICAKTGGYDPSSTCRGRALGAPFLAQLINFCHERPAMLDGGMFVYDMPFALTAQLYQTHLECNGNIRIENHAEAQMRQQLEQWETEAKAKPKAKPEPEGLATPIPEGLK